jgi:hypothetical protein
MIIGIEIGEIPYVLSDVNHNRYPLVSNNLIVRRELSGKVSFHSY